ncbi:hypothetical protein SAMN02745216_04181 [Desulfatibacillum alkenivorans DSM 16219]|jgi:hypothetical protein|uniref:Tocopherol cyclase n=1 Tax=Desulfatibacillum alkenivorans DSM 16219 TaxID=1121393 RepID=A0A1M6VRW5_9BACT|nr:hypothetical protein [Desulfatibacillum alkenivorans]SHK84218.1 hypothetical protein SAMN02745216_04181 [Desulfatibacillum alkenivorans DSM 16219]
MQATREDANKTRYAPGQKQGHYESYFLRANHPAKPQAFWIRYTIFSPNNEPDKAIGEVWAMVFDKETGKHTAAKIEVPISQTSFSKSGLQANIGDCTLDSGALKGSAETGGNEISWDLAYTGYAPPLLLLAEKLYEAGLPKAKACVPLPFASFSGTVTVNGQEWKLEEWIGSQNHNWGTKHTDLYAWGQVAGFDNSPDSFLELATARLKFGPVWTPYMTVVVLRHKGKEYALNTIPQSLMAQGRFDYFTWNFHSKSKEFSIRGRVEAEVEDFVGLTYYNPPGGVKHCLNSKIARCEIDLIDKQGETAHLYTNNRAAFEILTDKRDHGVKIMV